MAIPEKVWTKGDTVSIPVSLGIFVRGNSKRYTTGFVEATFLEYTPEGLANIRLGTAIFTVSKGQLVGFTNSPARLLVTGHLLYRSDIIYLAN